MTETTLKWHRCDERKPEEGEPVLLYCLGHIREASMSAEMGGGFVWSLNPDAGCWIVQPTDLWSPVGELHSDLAAAEGAL